MAKGKPLRGVVERWVVADLYRRLRSKSRQQTKTGGKGDKTDAVGTTTCRGVPVAEALAVVGTRVGLVSDTLLL